MPNVTELMTFADTLCDEAARITLGYFRQSVDVMQKKDASPVTIADRETEKTLRKLILATFPDHAIIGEEFGRSGESDWQWVLDPIDGTRSYISGFPTYATLIALFHHDKPVLSIIDMPALGERYIASSETNSTFNGQPIQVSGQSQLSHAKMQSTDPGMFTPERLSLIHI